MDDIYTSVLGACSALLVIEFLCRLLPEKHSLLPKGAAVLFMLVYLLLDLVEVLPEIQLPEPPYGEIGQNAEELYADTGIALLRERLYALLNAADIEIYNGKEGVEVRYRMADDGSIEIERVCVNAKYQTDTDRILALLRNVLTDAIPLEVYCGS